MFARKLGRAGLLVIGLLLIASQMVSAYTLSPLVINPDESLPPCTFVNVTFTIDNPQSDANDFPDAVDLEMNSELDRPTWSLTVLTDEGQSLLPVRHSDHATLSGWNLSGLNLNSSHETIQAVLSGYVPLVNQTGKRAVITLYQTDEFNQRINGSNRSVEPLFINTCCVLGCGTGGLHRVLADQERLRSHIDENTTHEIDTSGAEVYYSEAQQKIDSAKERPATQYAEAMRELDAAQTAIDEGEKALDRAAAEKSVADAQVPLQQTDQILSWYKGNKSTTSDENLPAIIAQRDLAAAALASANDSIAKGNYSQARAKAFEGYQIANTSYYEAVSCQKQLTCCYDPVHLILRGSGAVVIGTGIAAIIILIGGIFWWKKRKA